jgi:hypothetical protein
MAERALVLVFAHSGQQMAAVTMQLQFRQSKVGKVTKMLIFDGCHKISS